MTTARQRRGQRPIGVFDSGMGGLSVLGELRRELPGATFIYLADTAHVPYGERPEEEVRALTANAVDWLHASGCRGAVIACNTASAFSLDFLRERYGPEFPIVGLVPALKPAVAATQSGVVAVFATPVTLRGALLERVIQEFAAPAGVTVLKVSHPELVPLVEAGDADSPRSRALLREVLGLVAQAGADQLVLGCTHYPFLVSAIRAEFGDTFALLDSGAAVARRTHQILVPEAASGSGGVSYFVTGSPASAAPVMAALTGEQVQVGQATALHLFRPAQVTP
jgi:glutamate racemase